jgi:hypothetical protein
MYRLAPMLVAALAASLAGAPQVSVAQPSRGAIRGAISDSSNGAVPGVTVVATVIDGRVVATVVTDGTGAYELTALPAGVVHLTFQLDGFATAHTAVAVRPDSVSAVETHLEIAPVTETVVVVG